MPISLAGRLLVHSVYFRELGNSVPDPCECGEIIDGDDVCVRHTKCGEDRVHIFKFGVMYVYEGDHVVIEEIDLRSTLWYPTRCR